MKVMECEKEIQSIKSALKSLTSGGGSAEPSTNSLQVSVHKISASGGEDSTAPGTFKVHLSSPIEERTITQLFDPLDPNEGGVVTFEQLETSNALLTIEAFSNNSGDDVLVKVGTSAAHDLLPLCQDIDVNGEKITSTVEIAIVSESSEESSGKASLENKESDEWEDAVDEEKNEDGGATKESASQSPTKDTKLQLPLCTLSVQLEYTPSENDKRDSLYEKLNEVSKRKAAAIEKLRQSAAAVNRAKMAESDEGKGGNAVKAGFLNKSKPEAKAVPVWKRWYEKTIGPQSMLWVVSPIAKNYIIFIGCSVFFHYKGDLLALPPPV